MKRKGFIIASAAITVLIIISVVIGGLVMSGRFRPFREKITAFESVLLRESTMRGTSEYEIIPDGEKCEVSLYRFRYIDGKEERQLEKSAKCDTQTVIELLNECGVSAWDGFNGAHPRNVKDGTMFRFEANINGGKIIKAEGSANFPRNYGQFTSRVHEIISN